MFAFVEGTLIASGTEAIVAVGGGIGLDIQLSAVSAEQLPPVGDPIRLWTHLAVREDNWSLYGFVTQDERAMFRLLITVSGIGPKVALGMLSKVSATELAQSLRAGDEPALIRLPGVGKKSAARLAVELGQRVPEQIGGPGAGPRGVADGRGSGLSQAIAVLGAMGMGPGSAEQALLQARQNNPEVEQDLEKWVRAALRAM
jgi:holliday junction DNA helicase RuvA